LRLLAAPAKISVVDLSDKLATRLASDSDDSLVLSRVARRSAAEEVRAQLVAIIESGQLQVNDRLPSEAELSRRFGVSRPIVREALGSLQALGLTEPQPGRGTFVASNVTKMTLSFGQYSSSDLNEIRRCLEVPAARLAAERRQSEHVAGLRHILAEHDVATTSEDAVRYDGLFHCAIARATGNMLFLRLIEDLREILQEQSLAVSALRNRGAMAAEEHRAVLEAIDRGDGQAAAVAMDAHLDAVEVAIQQLARERSRSPRLRSSRRPLSGQAAETSSRKSGAKRTTRTKPTKELS
jgi:DNA-binding FadR family transcriptional regulator